MIRALPVTFAAVALTAISMASVPVSSVAIAATPAPASTLPNIPGLPALARTPPPEIYHVLSRPMCTELRKHILPAIAMMLQNDRTIAKSKPIFQDYMTTAFSGGDPTTGHSGDVTNYDSPGRTMALQHMEGLVTPLAQNVIEMQKIIDTTSLAHPTGSPEDDKALQDVRDKLLKAVADQSASLDLINGFVTTQQMGDMQHAGLENLNAIQGTDLSAKEQSQLATATPNPAFQDPDVIGLPPDPYDIDVTKIPGLQVGYNPIKMIVRGVEWTQSQTSDAENQVASATKSIADVCTERATPAPH